MDEIAELAPYANTDVEYTGDIYAENDNVEADE